MLERLKDVPKGIWLLGLVSMLMDISSEMIHALLPIYMVTVLGTSTLAVGVIEGIAEATASITKIFSGAMSDWLGRRKQLAAFGYGLAAFTKPVFPLAPSVGWLVAARFVDRIGKGIRGAPRDALIADISPPDALGASFGLRQSLDTIGAFVGPLLAIMLMLGTANSFATVFWIAVIPAFLSFLLIAIFVDEPERPPGLPTVRSPLSRAELERLGARYWLIVGLAAVFSLARFSEAFLVLRAQSVGLSVALVPAVLVAMNVAYALAAYPAGVPLGPNRPGRPSWCGARRLDGGRRYSRARRHPCWRRLWCRAVGPAHGPDTGSANNACRRYRPRRAAGHGLRRIQSCIWAGASRRQRHCERMMGCHRSQGDIPCGRCPGWNFVGWSHRRRLVWGGQRNPT